MTETGGDRGQPSHASGMRLSSGSTLTEREVEILVLIAEGRSNREIGNSLFLSTHTVEYYATRIYQKLGVRNRTEAGRAAYRLQLLDASVEEPRDSTVAGSRKSGVPEATDRGNLQANRASRSSRDMYRWTSWMATHWSSVRAGLVGAALLAIFSATAVAAGRLNVDERLLGYRLDQRLFGHPPEYHCINPTPQPVHSPWTPGPRPTPVLVQVPVAGTDDMVTGTPGDRCFQSEHAMWSYFGRDPKRPRCVFTQPAPADLREVVSVPVGEPLPESDSFCFGEYQELLDFFGFPSQP